MPDFFYALIGIPVFFILITFLIVCFLFAIQFAIKIDTRRREQLLTDQTNEIIACRLQGQLPVDVIYRYIYNLVKLGYREQDVLSRIYAIEDKIIKQKGEENNDHSERL